MGENHKMGENPKMEEHHKTDSKVKAQKEDPNPNKLISGHNEIILNRGSDLNEVAEQIDPFFNYHLVVIDNEKLDRLDKMELDRKTISFVEKVENKSQWIFKGPCECLHEDCKTDYVVFSSEAHEFMSNPSLAEFLPRQHLSSDESSESDSSSDSTCSTCDCSDKDRDEDRDEDKDEDKKEAQMDISYGRTGSYSSNSSISSSSDSSLEKSKSSEVISSEILTDGWSNSRSSDSIAGSIGNKRRTKLKIPSTVNIEKGPDTMYIPK